MALNQTSSLLEGIGIVSSWNFKTCSGIITTNDGIDIIVKDHTIYTRPNTYKQLHENERVEFKATQVLNPQTNTLFWESTFVSGKFYLSSDI